MAGTPLLIGTITGLTIASWGTGGAGTSTLGSIYKCTVRKGGEQDKVYDGNGFTIGQIFFDGTEEIDLEILALDAAALPARGDSLTADGVTGVVQESEKSYGYKQWKMITVKATKFEGMTIGA